MKLQIEGQHLRVRIDEDELARLLAGDAVQSQTRFADVFGMVCTLSLSPDAAPTLNGTAEAWVVRLPEATVRDLSSRLPTRDGLHFTLAGEGDDEALVLLFDVDVRASARRLKASRAR